MDFFKTLHTGVSCMALALAIAALYNVNKLTVEIIPIAQRVKALEDAPKDEVLEAVAQCRERAIEQTGVVSDYYKLCLDLVLDQVKAKKELQRSKKHQFYPADGE